MVPRRKKHRLPLDNYSKPGAYYITICNQTRRSLFGYFKEGILNYLPCGKMVIECWRRIPTEFEGIELDNFILMSNHIHAILWIQVCEVDQTDRELVPHLPRVIQWFKSITTVKYCHGVENNGWPRFESRLWQRSYYDHVIRSEKELYSIRNYIDQNPDRWLEDRYFAE